MNGRDAGTLYGQYAQLANEQVGDYDALLQELRTTTDEVRQERRDTARALAAIYLPELSEPALMAAERRTGFKGLSQRRPLEALAKEARSLRTRIAAMEGDEKWVKREALVGPYGTYTRQLAEAKDLGEPFEQECQRFEDQEGFLELVEIGYDTPAFGDRWWQPSYWRHWAAGDRICAALGMNDFGDDVLPVYLAARDPRDKWRLAASQAQGRIDEVHDHARQRDEAAWRLEHLPEIYLEEAQKLLGEHLERADVPLLASWAGEDRAVEILLKQLAGLGAKLDMLSEMATKWAAPVRRDLETAAAKMQLKAAKLSRPKKWSLQVPVPEGFESKMQTHAQRRAKARATMRRIRSWNDYGRFDLAQPPETWYLHMNDNRRPGIFTPGLRGWYDQHPDVVVVVDPDWQTGRGQPLQAAEVLAETGDIS